MLAKLVFFAAMSVQIASINSGSNGNCYYIGNGNAAILIDAGLTCRETEIRFKRIGIDIEKLKAIFISHEHTDHINGVAAIANKYQLPIYITEPTLANTKDLKKRKLNFIPFEEHVAIKIDAFSIVPFLKNHDAADPYSFIINCSGINIGVFTDIGIVCKQLAHYFSQCHAAFLETNYDDVMLENGSYPEQLKKRIRGNKGHLSNAQALQLFKDSGSTFISHLLLSHLSKENNSPDLAKKLFDEVAGKTEIIVASRYNPTSIYSIESAFTKKIVTLAPIVKPVQLNMFA